MQCIGSDTSCLFTAVRTGNRQQESCGASWYGSLWPDGHTRREIAMPEVCSASSCHGGAPFARGSARCWRLVL